jgi:hypothetical protein
MSRYYTAFKGIRKLVQFEKVNLSLAPFQQQKLEIFTWERWGTVGTP